MKKNYQLPEVEVHEIMAMQILADSGSESDREEISVGGETDEIVEVKAYLWKDSEW